MQPVGWDKVIASTMSASRGAAVSESSNKPELLNMSNLQMSLVTVQPSIKSISRKFIGRLKSIRKRRLEFQKRMPRSCPKTFVPVGE